MLQVPGTRSCHHIRTRGIENAVFADLHVLVDPELSMQEAHEIAQDVELHLQQKFPQIKEVLVHLEPDTPEERAER